MRVAVDGLVIHEGMVLLIDYDSPEMGPHVGLPGGGIETGEVAIVALQREVLEETGVRVTVGPLLMVTEAVPNVQGTNPEHELRLIFLCAPQVDQPVLAPTVPDPDQIGTRWVPLATLPQAGLLPKIGPQLYALALNPPVPQQFYAVI